MFEKKLLELVSHHTWRIAPLNSSRGGANRPGWEHGLFFACESNFSLLNHRYEKKFDVWMNHQLNHPRIVISTGA